MAKHSGKKKREAGANQADAKKNQTKVGDGSTSPRAFDKDTAIFVSLAQELKEDGDCLFQRRDFEGALLKYERTLKLLPRNHADVAQLRTNMASCHMELGLSEYPAAVQECNLALEVTPDHGVALLKRASCYEALNRLDLAMRDVSTVICMEPNNVTALEVWERVKEAIEEKGLKVNMDNSVIELPPEEIPPTPPPLREKARRKKNKNHEDRIEDKRTMEEMGEHKAEERSEEKKVDDKTEKKKGGNKTRKRKSGNRNKEKKAEDKAVVNEKITSVKEDEPTKAVKLVFEEDIRWARMPLNCSFLQLREVIKEKFPASRAFVVKYRDQEGDLVTIASNEELRWVEELPESQGSAVRLHIVEVCPEKDPLFEKLQTKKQSTVAENRGIQNKKAGENGSTYVDDWIVEFSQLFKNYLGLDSDGYLDLHELGMKQFTEAMEEVITTEEAQDLFGKAAEKFQEMAALALFNWGNVHMSRARKRVYFSEGASKENIIDQISATYDWAVKEYSEAGIKYEEALKIKPDFYEGLLALGQQQFEQAKLSWYYAVGTNADLDAWPSTDILELYNSSEENFDKGVQILVEAEEQCEAELSEPCKAKALLQKMGLEKLFTDISESEAEQQAEDMRAQINILWGTMLYERSIVEYKLGLPVWHECLEVAIEKFELAGASPADTTAMIQNHCSNNDSNQGLPFKIDEMVQAWNEKYEAKWWSSGVQSFRLEPLLRRRVSKLFNAFDNA